MDKASRRKARANSGVSTALVIAFAFFLGVCIFALIKLSFFFAATEQANNAIDASALNVAEKVLTITTPPIESGPPQNTAGGGSGRLPHGIFVANPCNSAAPEGIFKDVADSSGLISLANINRVWGEAIIISANVQSMINEHQDGKEAKRNGEIAYYSAQATNDNLLLRLSSTSTLRTFFKEIAAQRTANMLGQGSSVVAKANADVWPSALLDRGEESNISFAPKQIPPDANIKVPTAASSVAGYSPIQINNHFMYMVPFRNGEMSHLVSNRVFDLNRSDKTPILTIPKALPNGFAAYGTAYGSEGSLASSAYVVTNPLRRFQLAIPHAYISIQITGIAKWFVQGKQVNETSYSNPETQWGIKNIKLPNGGTLNGYASVGNDFNKSTLSQVMGDALNNSTLVNNIVQRMQEVSPDFDSTKLLNLLQSQQLSPDASQYVIYPIYNNPDNTDCRIAIAPVVMGKLPKWLDPCYPEDGTEKVMSTSSASSPNSNWQELLGADKPNGHHTTMLVQSSWEPDSGLFQCLGQVRISHITNLYFAED